MSDSTSVWGKSLLEPIIKDYYFYNLIIKSKFELYFELIDDLPLVHKKHLHDHIINPEEINKEDKNE
jgi:hypothetical protein